jgi:integrase
MAQKRARRRPQGGGSVRQLPSGRWQARWRDEHDAMHPAPDTFDTRLDAETWLDRESWLEVAAAVVVERQDPTLTVYAGAWLAGRDLKPRTRAHYRRLLDQQILPALGALRLSEVTPAVVRSWYGEQDRAKPTLRAHAYALLRTVMTSAVDEDIVPTNPCRIRGAGVSRRARSIEPATLPQLELIVAKMPEAYRPLVLLAAWCALRAGEVTELRRRDVDVDAGVIHVRRGVVWLEGAYVVGDPKSAAGVRDVAIPPHLLPMLETHLDKRTAKGPDALLFPGKHGEHLPPSTLRGMWHTARSAAKRDDLRFHDLRHTGAVLAASTGATLAELMARLGHSTPGAAMRYQHAAADRDQAIAQALSDLVGGSNVVPITKPRRRTASGK